MAFVLLYSPKSSCQLPANRVDLISNFLLSKLFLSVPCPVRHRGCLTSSSRRNFALSDCERPKPALLPVP